MRKIMSLLILSMGISLFGLINTAKAGDVQPEASLYQRLGGYEAIVAVVDNLFPRLANDQQLGRFWEHRGNDGIAREKQLLIDFIANQAGGELYYRGREMKLLHEGMRISESDWTVFWDHLNDTLDQFNLPDRERQDVLVFIKSTKEDIVELP